MTNVLVLQMCDEEENSSSGVVVHRLVVETRNSYDDYTQNTEKQSDLYHCNTALTTIVI
jgi:hypothetical protein